MSNLLAKIKILLPRPVEQGLINLVSFKEDLLHPGRKRSLFGAQADLVPPLRLMHDGPRGYAVFKENGDEYFRYYRELGQLKPTDRVLDVGCGIGRKTIPLLNYLNAQGGYEGMDIVASGIEWCSRKITPKYPNFRFQVIDVYNQHYHPEGKYRDYEYHFPFADASFDFIALGSVFTHMLPRGVDNYLTEIARVLRPGGRCLISYFLLNAESEKDIREGRSTLAITEDLDGCRVLSKTDPEWATAHFEERILRQYAALRLRAQTPPAYGSWCGRSKYTSYQDIVVATKV